MAKTKNLPLKSKPNICVDRKHLEEPFLREQIIRFVFVHYCLSPLAVSINRQPSSLSEYLTCSINHSSSLFFHEMFTVFLSLSLSSSTSLYHFPSSHEVSSDVFVKDGKAIILVIESQHSFMIRVCRFLGPHSIGRPASQLCSCNAKEKFDISGNMLICFLAEN